MIGSRLTYLACMLVATVAAAVLLRRSQQVLTIDRVAKLGIALGGIIGATFAAKLPFILGADPAAGLAAAWLSDGKTVLWGLAGGYVGVEIAKWSFRVRVSTGDTFVIPVAIAVAIGRLGCLLYGCCYGIATDQSWGLRFANAPDAGSLLRHPAQLYELAFHLGFAVLAWMELSRPKRGVDSALAGNWMPIYLCAYSGFRFLTEFVRPEAAYSAGLTFYQWSAIGIGSTFALLLVVRLTHLARKFNGMV